MATHAAARELLPLQPGEVHVWIVEPGQVQSPRLQEIYRALLDEEERQRHLRFRFEHLRLLYLVAHALVRTTLSRYAPVEPAAWRFVAGARGRPEVAPGLPRLRFNLSHTEGMAVCAVAREDDVGVDVEDSERRGQTAEIAEHYFAPSEVAALRALPVEQQRARFFEYWTLKESYIKARGEGLALPLAHFAFHLEPGRRPRIRFDPRLVDDEQAWQFVQLWPSQRYPVALAVRRGRALPLAVRWQRVVPLESEGLAERLLLAPEG
jgi:4'-phosphopantetheinyl transferase